MSSDDVLTQAAQRLRELATQIDRQAALSARPGQLEVLERIAAKVRDCADVVHGAAVPVSAPTREALTDTLREAFNTAYERSDNPRVDTMHRHDQHQYAGACHVCRGDVAVLVPHIADRMISAGLVRTPVTQDPLLTDAIDLLADLAADDPCSPNSVGYCVTHAWFYDSPCPQKRLREFSAKLGVSDTQLISDTVSDGNPSPGGER